MVQLLTRLQSDCEVVDVADCFVLEVVGRKQSVLFVKLRDLFPECEFLLRDAPQLFPFRCLQDYCPRNQNCMEKLAKRTKYVFDTFKDVTLLLVYFSYPDMPGSHRAGVFWRDVEKTPKYIVFNRTTWERMKRIGTVYKWSLPSSVFLT